MKKQLWIAGIVVILLVAAVALLYRFNPPTRSWIQAHLSSSSNDQNTPKSVEEINAKVTREKSELETRLKKEEEEKSKEIEKLKAEKEALQAELKKRKAEAGR